jgi:type II secretory pathway component PulC
LLTLFPERPDIHVKLLRAGDLVQRINGRSLERPEQFQAVWESLAQADELVIELRRDTQPTKLRFAITP